MQRRQVLFASLGWAGLAQAAPNKTEPLQWRQRAMLGLGTTLTLRAAHADAAQAEAALARSEAQLRQSARIWDAAGGYAPTIGILGAVMGLIHVMENLSDPSKLGAGIAVAFVATIYGVGCANLVFLPIAKKLVAHISALTLQREMFVDGIVGIANGDNPRIIASRMQGYVV